MDHIIGYSIACFSASDIKINTFCVWHRPVVHLTGKFQVIIHINQFRWYNQFVTVWTHQNCMLLRQYNLNTSIVPSSCPTHDWEGKAPLHTPPLIVHSTLLDLAETCFRIKFFVFYLATLPRYYHLFPKIYRRHAQYQSASSISKIWLELHNLKSRSRDPDHAH